MINFIDIGARGGISPPWKREYIDHLILCDAHFKEKAKDDKCRVLDKCLYNDNKKRFFYIYHKRNISSLFKFDSKILFKLGKSQKVISKHYKLIKRKKIKCCRLDTLLSNYDESYNFIKTDAQGADLAILQGLGKHIDNMVGVHCECFLVPWYKGIPLYSDIRSFLGDHGIYPSRVITKKKTWVDILFVRDEISENRKFIDDIYSQYLPYTENSLFLRTMRPYMKG